MRALPWVIAGVGIGVGVTILLFSESEPDYATGYSGVERAARKTFNWGTKQRAEGMVGSAAGAIKEGPPNHAVLFGKDDPDSRSADGEP